VTVEADSALCHSLLQPSLATVITKMANKKSDLIGENAILFLFYRLTAEDEIYSVQFLIML
jgi:hypothetical protein